MTEATSFAPGDRFLIIGGLKDSAGNTLPADINARQLLPSGGTLAIPTFNDVEGKSTHNIAVIEDDPLKAKLGSYDVEVSAGSLTQNVVITVSGKATMFDISGASFIPLGGAETYTVTATDSAGNMPSGDTCFTVKLRASEANSEDDVAIARDAETGTDCAAMGESMLDKKTASVTFTVFAPVDAVQGARGTIVVLVSNQVKAQHAVMFDAEPTAPTAPACP